MTSSPDLSDVATDDVDEDIESPRPPSRWPFAEMLVSSIIGLYASFVLSVDALILAANPDADLSCNINAQISCGAVGTTWQANLFGWPNAFLGMIAEPVVITVAVLGLARVRFPRAFLLTAQFVYTLGFIFALWLFYQSYFNIHALCPWCLLVTVTTILVWTSMTRINIEAGNFGEGVRRKLTPALNYNADIFGSILFIAILAAMVVYRYAGGGTRHTVSMHLAQVNVSRALAPIDSPLMAEFVARIDATNAAAERAPGFVWRYADAVPQYVARRLFGEADIVVNLSVWESPEHLREYVFADRSHAEALRMRRSWFAAPSKPMVACWWVAPGETPSLRDAAERLSVLRSVGAGPTAFPLTAAADFPPPV